MINVLLILKKSKESTEKEDLGLLYNNSGGGGAGVHSSSATAELWPRKSFRPPESSFHTFLISSQ